MIKKELEIRAIGYLTGEVRRKNDLIEKALKRIKRLERKISGMKRAETAVSMLGELSVPAAVYILLYVIKTKIKQRYGQ